MSATEVMIGNQAISYIMLLENCFIDTFMTGRHGNIRR
jgi:hypothetical protein